MAQLPLEEGIPRFKANEERVDVFTNGTDSQDVTLTDGTVMPSIRKFYKGINTAGEGWLAEAQEAAAEVEQTEPQSEIGKVIGSIERSAFSQAIAREAQAAPTEQAVDPFAPKEEPKQEKKYRVRFFADGTKEQLGKLIAFMNENNIKYGKIAKESK